MRGSKRQGHVLTFTVCPFRRGCLSNRGFFFYAVFYYNVVMHKKYLKSVYLDYAAATPIDFRVQKAMTPFLRGVFGNPSSLHQEGRKAKLAFDQARVDIAKIINAKPSEIIFTAGGSESVNLAIFGVARNHRKSKRGAEPHFITSVIEHHCVINSFKALEGEGHKITFVDVDSEGFIKIDKLKKSIRPETVLISVMCANNEIGAIEPIGEIAKWLKQINTERERNGLTRILFHTDACQAAGILDLNVQRLGVDLMSINGSKIYGPKQSGALYIRSGINIEPLIYGGGQERGIRAGTENVAGAVGLAKALSLVDNHREKENQRLLSLSNFLIKQIKTRIPNVLLNGAENGQLKVYRNYKHQQNIKYNQLKRLPNNINFTFKGVEGEALMLYLDARGFEVSTASACSTGNTEASHVLLAIGRSQEQAQSSIRFSLGKFTALNDLKNLMNILPKLVKDLRNVRKK